MEEEKKTSQMIMADETDDGGLTPDIDIFKELDTK